MREDGRDNKLSPQYNSPTYVSPSASLLFVRIALQKDIYLGDYRTGVTVVLSAVLDYTRFNVNQNSVLLAM